MTHWRGLLVAWVLAAAGCGSETGDTLAVTNETIPPGTSLADIERTLTDLGGSYLVTRSEVCGSSRDARPAVVAVMDRGRSLMNRAEGATVVICLDANQRATRVVYDTP